MYVLVADVRGLNYFVQEYKKPFNIYDGVETEFRLNGLVDNAMRFETIHGARMMQSRLQSDIPHALVPMEIKKK